MSHAHSGSTTSRGRLLATLLLNWSITIAELVGGLWSGSLSLLSDALHNFSDGLAIIIAYLHLFSDAISSLAVMLGGMAISLLGIYWLDPLLTLLISLYVLKESFRIVGEATDMLLMASPEGLSLSELQRAVELIPGVDNLHHAHLWQLNEHDVHFEAHLEVGENLSIRQAQALGKRVENLLEASFGINHVTVQFECDACSSKALLKSEASS